MKVVVAMDKFKHSLTSEQAGEGVKRGLENAGLKADNISLIPMADGGEGTSRLLTRHDGGEWIHTEVEGPHGERVSAGYGLGAKRRTGFVDMADAAGLDNVPGTPQPHHVSSAHTYGVGQLIEQMLGHFVERIYIALGGSATVDGGAGMAMALGYQLLDISQNPIPRGGAALNRLDHIDTAQADSRIQETHFTALCDVDHPLLGAQGAAAQFARQKGADQRMARSLESGLIRLNRCFRKGGWPRLAFARGAGAAGGMGAGAAFFLDAELFPGSQYVGQTQGLPGAIAEADLVISGEGKVDEGSFKGKVLGYVAKLCAHFQKPLYVIAGDAHRSIWTHPQAYGIQELDLLEAIDPLAARAPAQQQMELIAQLSTRHLQMGFKVA